ncbi:hypothetical protein ABID29_002089 [Streptococcus rupicaprae]|uniref:Uncharacterized protein n=1 Tax=Streptococcus rupicaprae TaxID=759619 RepID=A0ABV2FK39_9STRE
MNSVVFFAELEKAFQNSSFAELKEIILSLAKQVAAEDREVFLKTHFGTSLVSRQQVDVVWDETDFLLEQLRAIEQGELTLLAKFNEHFDDWYDDWDGMFEFSDDDGLVTILKQVLLLIDTLLNQNKLVEALELAKRLEQLEVGVDGDYNDYTADRFTLISFEEYGLMPNVYKPFLSQLIYLTYQTTNLGERAEALFSLFEKNRHYRLSLDELLQEWGIFEDLQEFLPLWLDYLGKTKGDLAYKLLVEALDLKTEETDVFAFAKSVALVHPTFLGTYFKENSSSLAPAVCLAKGYEALKLLPINESNRSDIALLLTSFVDDESERYGLWVEVFKTWLISSVCFP